MGVKPGGAWWILGMGAISTHGEEPKYPDAGPVTSFMLTPSATSVTMSWMPPTPLPGVVPPFGYVVKLEETGETVDVTGTNYIWEGLQIDTSYCFSVYSKSELGILSDPVTDCVVTLKEVGADDAAQITHIGTSTFAISNPTRGIFEYYLSRSDTDFSQASLIADPSSFAVTRSGSPYYVLTTYPGVTETSLMRKTSFVCRSITYHTENHQTCSSNCGVCCNPDAGNGSGNCFGGGACWCGGCAADGTICCGGCYGQSCSGNPNAQVKDPVPAGYTERYGEWVSISTSPTALTKQKETGVFSLGSVDWDFDYYQEVDMPVPYEASVFDEKTGEPTGETIPDRPAWDYTNVYFINYDFNGNVVWMKDHINDPECFTVIEIENMKKYQMLVRKLPAAQKGSYEFVIANNDEEFVRIEGTV